MQTSPRRLGHREEPAGSPRSATAAFVDVKPSPNGRSERLLQAMAVTTQTTTAYADRRDDMSDQPQRLRDILASEPLLLTPEEAAVQRVGRTTVYALMKSRATCMRSTSDAAADCPAPSYSATSIASPLVQRRQQRQCKRKGRTSTNEGELFDVFPRPAIRR
jgi:hypothetical protein